jgi:hypothetical protein
MSDTFSSIPWNTAALWQAANAGLGVSLDRNRAALDDARGHAQRLRHLLERTFPIMEELCRQTCPACTDVCCQRAWVWADFKDLLFFHLAGIDPPDHQLLSRKGEHCRYASPDGCRLERIQRPFVCTWYLCPAQTQRLRQAPAEMKIVSESLQHIKQLRQEMERSFIWAVT